MLDLTGTVHLYTWVGIELEVLGFSQFEKLWVVDNHVILVSAPVPILPFALGLEFGIGIESRGTGIGTRV